MDALLAYGVTRRRVSVSNLPGRLQSGRRGAEAARRLRETGFEIGNIDGTVIAQAPKLMPFIAAMRANIAQTLGLQLD